MTLQEFTQNAGAYFSGAITVLCFNVIAWLMRRKQVVQLVRGPSTPYFDPPGSSKRDLEVLYRGRPVSALYLTSFQIRNLGKDSIEGIDLRLDLEFGSQAAVLEIRHEDRQQRSRICEGIIDEGSAVTFKIPFLNGYSDHKDEIVLLVMSESPILTVRVTGAGKGWSSKLTAKSNLEYSAIPIRALEIALALSKR
jgi:hypothetical protein